ncbi:replication protein A 70 kDa DNA-binding subunit-like [Planococcus citri]|uniref:replication protein A 70 kDa DNA-binding subunit-like n=1 Tax=Planococcus citri TaxID=170843 RepID=UPI0031F85104
MDYDFGICMDLELESTVSSDSSSSSFSSSNSSVFYNDLDCYVIVEESSPTAIRKLNLFTTYSNPNWFVKALVINKSNVRSYHNHRQGKYFTLELSDGSATIRAVAFNGACDKFCNVIEVNKTYLISGCQIQQANRMYNQLPHKYELVLQRSSQIEPYLENTSAQGEKGTELPLIKTWTLIDLAREQLKKITKKLYHVEATVLDIDIPIDKVVYEGCPRSECKKKVVRRDNLGFYCVKCDETYPNFEYRYMLKVYIADWTGKLKLTLFEVADEFLGISAPAIVELCHTNYANYEIFLKKRLYDRLTFVVAAEMKEYNDQDHVDGVCCNYYPIDYRNSTRGLLRTHAKTE